MVNDLKWVNKEYQEAIKKLSENDELLKEWYFYFEPIFKEFICDICGNQNSYGHFLIEIFEVDLVELLETNGFEGMFMDKQVCNYCLGKVRLFQRDFAKKNFWEDWDSENGVEIICLKCGWYGFVNAKWDSFGGELVISEWVCKEESYHLGVCDY
jgi:hypothetical protein